MAKTRTSFTKETGKRAREKQGRSAKLGKGTPEEAKRLYRDHTLEAVQFQIDLMRSKKASSRERLRAAEIITERGLGKVPQPIEVTEIPIVNDDIRDRPDKTDDND